MSRNPKWLLPVLVAAWVASLFIPSPPLPEIEGRAGFTTSVLTLAMTAERVVEAYRRSKEKEGSTT